MSFNEKTYNNILNGRISIIQPKKGFRFGSDSVFLASFVNTFLENKKNRNFLIADVGSGIGTVSLIIAFRNSNTNILAIDNKKQYLMLAKENIKINGFQDKIKTINNDIFNLDNNLKNCFDVVVSNPPFYKRENNKSNNKLEDSSKRIVNLKEWLENSLKLLKDKGLIFLITSTDILDDIINHLSEKAGSFKISYTLDKLQDQQFLAKAGNDYSQIAIFEAKDFGDVKDCITPPCETADNTTSTASITEKETKH